MKSQSGRRRRDYVAARTDTLGISKSHLCDIEKGRKPVSAARAAAMARILGYSEKQFVLLALQDAMRRAGLDYNVRISAA